MPRRYKIALFWAFVVLLAFDVHAIAQHFLRVPVDPVAWDKAIGAFIIQVLACAAGAAYLGFLGRRSRRNAGDSSFGMLEDWRLKFWPLGALAAPVAFSVSLLFNSMACGTQPFPPTARGTRMCHKAAG